jgi:hypothetical protein
MDQLSKKAAGSSKKQREEYFQRAFLPDHRPEYFKDKTGPYNKKR